MAKGDWFWKSRERLNRIKKAEADNRVADSHEVRLDIVRRMKSGDITLQEGQAELANIKRNAKKNGKVTRNQAWRGE